jgi:hypothetical protein
VPAWKAPPLIISCGGLRPDLLYSLVNGHFGETSQCDQGLRGSVHENYS